MSIKEYAVANKISIYNVIKMAKNGTLRTQTQKVEGKDELFILADETQKNQDTVISSAEKETVDDYQKAYHKLKIKYDQLQMKYDTLQKRFSKEA
jgi:DNA/RNA-binding domain of Phe-tRNA-synthetase-like protein